MLQNSTTIEDINKAMELFNAIPVLDKWIVVRPDGKTFAGKVTDILPVILNEHPMFKFNPMLTPSA